MVRILTVLIVIALFLGVRDYTTLDRVTDALSSAPYGEDRRNIKPGFGWREFRAGRWTRRSIRDMPVRNG